MSFFSDIYSSDYYEAAAQFHVNPDNCENPQHYDDYLKYNALIDMKKGLAVTYIFCEKNDETEDIKIMGFVSLKASSLVVDEGEKIKCGYPAVEIAELAVSQEYERNGKGTEFVEFALAKACELSTSIGIKYLVLCADPSAVQFYQNENLKFIQLDGQYQGQIPRERWNMTCVPMAKKIV